MLAHTSHYGFGTVVAISHADALERVRRELAREGFGIITEMDMAATLRKKLGVEIRPYVILGACLPALAHQALAAQPDAGLLLPCNVAVYAEDAERTMIAALDPEVMLGLARDPALEPLASEARGRLTRALEAVRDDADATPHPAAALEVADEIC